MAMTRSRINWVLGCSLSLVAGCAGTPQTPTLPAHQAAHQTAHWGYAGAGGPERWASLDPSFAQCGHGQAQTPIDIPASVVPGLAHDLALSYKPSALHLNDNGHTIQADYDPGSYITLGESRYDLVQFHFHAHSEHTVAGKPYPLELHLVHKGARVRGRITTNKGTPVESDARAVLVGRSPLALPRKAVGEIDRDGKFVVGTLLPGRYEISVRVGARILQITSGPREVEIPIDPGATVDLSETIVVRPSLEE